MSKKIYEAYKLPLPELNAFASAVKAHAIKKADEFIVVSVHEICRVWFEFLSKGTSKAFLDEYARKTGWSFWIRDGFVYALPYGVMNNGLDFTSMPFVEKFHYWNNVEADEDVPEDEWHRRGEVWDDILDNEDKYPSFSLHTFDISEFIGTPELDMLQKTKTRIAK